MERIRRRFDGFWKWYFKQGWEKPVSACGQLLVFLAVIAILAYASSRDSRAREFWTFFIRDPFFLLAWLVLIASYIDLNYMRYRLEQSGYSGKDLDGRLKEQNKVLEQYRRTFGVDKFARFWAFRWCFLVFGLISGIRYILR